jgi:hypothetical protein
MFSYINTLKQEYAWKFEMIYLNIFMLWNNLSKKIQVLVTHWLKCFGIYILINSCLDIFDPLKKTYSSNMENIITKVFWHAQNLKSRTNHNKTRCNPKSNH